MQRIQQYKYIIRKKIKNNRMVNELTRENFDKAIKRTQHRFVVEFYSATCKHCKKLEAGITELSEEAGNEVYFGKVLIPDQLFWQRNMRLVPYRHCCILRTEKSEKNP